MTDIIETTLKNRYYQKDEHHWNDVAKRVANFLQNSENERDTFYHLISNKWFLPNSPTLMNAGTEIGQLSACFVIPIEDSIESIGKAITDAMLTHKTGGGTGFSFGRLRPNNAVVNSTDGVASGAVSFMKIFDAATEQIKQGGKRRGANMAVLPVYHPDIEEFINCKQEEGVLSNFNISVGITDAFMQAVFDKESHKFALHHPVTGHVNIIDAKELFNKICHNMWNNGEPGVVFLDTVNSNPCFDETIESTNPCGEQPLPPYGNCTLGSIDISKYYIGGKYRNDFGKFSDWAFNHKLLDNDIKLSVDILNRVVDKNKYPIPEFAEVAKKYRSIGLGYMGFADLLLKLGIRYGSDDCISLVDMFAGQLYKNAIAYSNAMGYKNATVISYAPTGTISLIAGCSSGIEPNFAFEYERSTWTSGIEEKFMQYHPLYKEWKDAHPDDELPDYFVTASEVTPEEHIKVQAAFQRYCDSGISKTINVPNDSPEASIGSYIFQAWESGCKGFTMYRDGSRVSQVLTATNKELIAMPEDVILVPAGEPTSTVNRPDTLFGATYKKQSGCGKLYVTVNEQNSKPYEVIVQTAGVGGCAANSEALGRAISVGLRNGVSASEYIKQMSRVVCPKCKNGKKVDGKSCADIVGRCLSMGVEFEQEQKQLQNTAVKTIPEMFAAIETELCPECGAKLTMAEGCMNCPNCTWSRC